MDYKKFWAEFWRIFSFQAVVWVLVEFWRQFMPFEYFLPQYLWQLPLVIATISGLFVVLHSAQSPMGEVWRRQDWVEKLFIAYCWLFLYHLLILPWWLVYLACGDWMNQPQWYWLLKFLRFNCGMFFSWFIIEWIYLEIVFYRELKNKRQIKIG